MEFLIALLYLSLNIKISNYHPCLEADVNEKEKCPIYKGPHLYLEKKIQNIDVFEGDDLPWESLNMFIIPWNPFLKDVETKIGKNYPDVWVSLPRIIDHPSGEDIPVLHPYMPRDYYKKEKKTRKEKTEEEGMKHLVVLASITFAILSKVCSIVTLYRRNRYEAKEESEIEYLTIDIQI